MWFEAKADRRTRNEPPRFCTRCLRARSRDERLCAECGESLLSQGFCGICESFWKLPVGSACPKHDSPLETGPAVRKSPLEPGELPVWETVGVFVHALDAGAARSRLEVEGIPTFLDGERMGAHHTVASGGVRLQVPRRWAQPARGLLSSPDFALTDETDWCDDHEDAEEEHEPVLGRILGWGLLMLLGVLLIVIVAKTLGVGG